MSDTLQARRPWHRPDQWPVWAVPALLGSFQVIGSFGAQSGATTGPHTYPHTDLDALGIALLLGGPLALLMRRRHRIAVLGVVAVLTMLYYLRAYAFGPAPLSAGFSLMGVVMAGHRRVVWWGIAAAYTGFFTLTRLFGAESGAPDRFDRLLPIERPTLFVITFWTGWTVALITGAEIVRVRKERTAETARVHAEEERRQASDERLRIARELHDVLAHNISMINVQAGVALHLMDQNPEQARTALAAIKDASKEALSEMRSVIGILRQQGESAPRSPTAGLDLLEDLLNRARTAGLDVRHQIEGARQPLPAGTDLAAFRIVQESLTNVTRHAGTGQVTATVRIAYGEHEIAVQVDDDGQGVSLLDDQPHGSGLNGMRERAAALGGAFAAGPRPGGGFRVRAVLPLEEIPAQPAPGPSSDTGSAT